MKNKKKSWKYPLISVCSVFAVLLIWYVCINVLKLKPEIVFPGPLTVAKTFIGKFYTKAPDGATMLVHLASSLKVALLGYALGVLFGVPMGILMAWSKWVDRLVRPLFDLIRPVPGLAWIPMFILIFGIGIMPKAAVIFLSTAVACIINSYTGIRQTRQEHMWVGNVFGATNAQKLFRIAIPTALPMIFTGLRVAMGAAWMALVAAELLAEKLEAKGQKVTVHDLARTDMAEAVEDAFRYGKLVLATTTYNGDVFPFMKTFIHHLTERNFQNRMVGFMENGSWAPVAAKTMQKMLEGSKNLLVAEPIVTVQSALSDTSRSHIDALAHTLCP